MSQGNSIEKIRGGSPRFSSGLLMHIYRSVQTHTNTYTPPHIHVGERQIDRQRGQRQTEDRDSQADRETKKGRPETTPFKVE